MSRGLRSATSPRQTQDPVSLIPSRGGIAWLSESTSLVGRGPMLSIDPGTGPDRFRRGAEAVAAVLQDAEVLDEVDVPGTGPVVFGSWTFDEDSPGSRLIFPSVVYGFTEETAFKTTVDFGARAPDPPEAAGAAEPDRGDSLDEAGWMKAVQDALDAIGAGRMDKVVLARKLVLEQPEPIDQQVLAGRLRREYPGCFTFCFADLVGATPELLVRRVGDLVDSGPLAGSAPRGATETEDQQLGQALMQSPKNLAEHALAVDTVMERLGPLCSKIVSESEPSLLLLANLQHLSTKIQGRLSGSPNALELTGALHPTAAVCGVPQDAAMQAIRRLEGFDRGRYAGPVGWMDRHGDGEWALALRCAQIHEMRAEVFAGAGIVSGSDPASELEETALKLRAILNALGPQGDRLQAEP